MRILHVIPSLGGGGAERQLSLLAPALCARGVEVHVAHLGAGEYRDGLAQRGVALHPLAVRGHRDPRLPQRLYRTLRAVRPDIVHTWLPVMDAVGGAVATASRTAWLLSERTVAEAYASPSIIMRLRVLVAPRAAGVIGNSRLGLEQWRDVFPAERRFLVPNALPLADIAETQALARTELPLDPAAPLVVYAGRFAPEKNIEVLIGALCAVVADGAVAVLCGAGPERPRAERLVRAAGLAGRIHFTGYRVDLWRVLKAAAVVVSVSRFEGTPNVVLEAAACGAPLLLSNIPAHRELLGPDAAHFVNPSDARAVADTLRGMLAHPARLERRAARARQLTRARDPERAAAPLLAAYEAVLQQAPAAAASGRAGGAC